MVGEVLGLELVLERRGESRVEGLCQHSCWASEGQEAALGQSATGSECGGAGHAPRVPPGMFWGPPRPSHRPLPQWAECGTLCSMEGIIEWG